MNAAKPKKCRDCKLYRKQCTLNTRFIPKYLHNDQRDRWIEAWYLKALDHDVCDEYEGWQEFVEEHKVTVECKDIQHG